jgi:3-hydroxyacyl-[acyl-carrier-protein] dehydratase
MLCRSRSCAEQPTIYTRSVQPSAGPDTIPAAPFGREVIETIIPHRDPFLFLDEVLELEPGARVVARKRVLGDEWFFPGHFPGRPIMPGVIMVEALAQAGAIAALALEKNRGKLALFAGIDGVRFKRIVEPGDELTLACELETVRGPVGRGRATARVGDELAVRGTLTFATAAT